MILFPSQEQEEYYNLNPYNSIRLELPKEYQGIATIAVNIQGLERL